MADIKGAMKALFPFISMAASLGGPLGTMAAGAVGKALGIDKVDATPGAVAMAINGATPEQVMALKKAEQDFQLQMAELGFKNVADLEKIAADDRASARQREVASHDVWTPRIIACAIIAGWIFVQYYLLTHVIDAKMEVLNARMLGTLDAALTFVLGYYFGSSAGSERKTELMGQPQAPPA